jgi:hypothetical protein
VCHTEALAIYIQRYLKAKEESWKTQIFHHTKIYNLQKNSSEKRNQKSFMINSILTNLKFQHNLAKISSFKNPHIKIDLLLLLSRGQNLLKLIYIYIYIYIHSIMNLNTINNNTFVFYNRSTKGKQPLSEFPFVIQTRIFEYPSDTEN